MTQPATTRPAPASVQLQLGTVEVCVWSGGKTAAFSIFSDDGEIRSIKSTWTPEHPDVPFDGFYALGEKYKIPVTFFIMPKYISTRQFDYSEVAEAGNFRFSVSAWADWQFMHDHGHEISSHTYSHGDFRPDDVRLHLNDGIERPLPDAHLECQLAIDLITQYIGERPITCEWPYANGDEWTVLCRKYYPLLTYDIGRHRDEIVGCGYRTGTKPEFVQERLDRALAEGKWLSMGGHGIRTELGAKEEAVYGYPPADPRWKQEKIRRHDGYTPIEYPALERIFQMAADHRDQLFIGQFKNVARYMYERRAATIRTLRDDPNEAVIVVGHDLDPTVFNYPLTLRVHLTKSAEALLVKQQGKRLPVTDRGRDFLVDVVPIPGSEITIGLGRN